MLYEKGTIKSVYTENKQYTDKQGNQNNFDINVVQIESTAKSGKIIFQEYNFSKTMMDNNPEIFTEYKEYINKEVFIPVYKFKDAFIKKDGSIGYNNKDYVADLPELVKK